MVSPKLAPSSEAISRNWWRVGDVIAWMGCEVSCRGRSVQLFFFAFRDRIVGVFLAFQSQRIPTDGNGKPSPNAKPLSSVIARVRQPTPVTPAVYL